MELAQRVMCLPPKNEDLSLNPQHHIKKRKEKEPGTVVTPVIPVWRWGDRQIPGAHWPASLAVSREQEVIVWEK